MVPADPTGSSPGDLLARAWDAYRAGDAGRARACAQAAIDGDPAWGEAWYARACAAERAGDLAEADRDFARAAHAARDPVAAPFRCPWARFRDLVDRAAAGIPPGLQRAFRELTLVLEDYADPALLAEREEPELLGMFIGAPRGEEPAPGELSPRIHLWRRAHEHACGSAAELAAELRTTLVHEFGHYLGYDEDGLARLGLG